MGQLAVLTLATGDVRVLVTDPPLLPGHVSWSSDDSEIVFAAYPPVGIRADLFVVTARGGTPRRLGTGCYSVSSPSWAANGRIAFTGACPDAPDSGVFTVRPDGSGRIFVASSSDLTRGASWSPNSDRLVFSRMRSDVCCDLGDIVVAKADGTRSRRLTRNFSENKDPVWAP
jgi:Tol biopolymer transport system component